MSIARQILSAVGLPPAEDDVVPASVGSASSSSLRHKRHHRLNNNKLKKKGERHVEPVDNDEVSVNTNDTSAGEEGDNDDQVSMASSKASSKKTKKRSSGAFWDDMRHSMSKSTEKFIRASRAHRSSNCSTGSVSSAGSRSVRSDSTRGSTKKSKRGKLSKTNKRGSHFTPPASPSTSKELTAVMSQSQSPGGWGDLSHSSRMLRNSEFDDVISTVPILFGHDTSDTYHDDESPSLYKHKYGDSLYRESKQDDDKVSDLAFDDSHDRKMAAREEESRARKKCKKKKKKRRSASRAALDESQHSEYSDMSSSFSSASSTVSTPQSPRSTKSTRSATSRRSKSSLAGGNWGDFAEMHSRRGNLNEQGEDVVVSPAYWADDSFTSTSYSQDHEDSVSSDYSYSTEPRTFTKMPQNDSFSDLDQIQMEGDVANRQLLSDEWKDVFALTPERSEESFDGRLFSGAESSDDEDEDESGVGIGFLSKTLFGKDIILEEHPDRLTVNELQAQAQAPQLPPRVNSDETNDTPSSHLLEMLMKGSNGIDRAVLLSKMDKTLKSKSSKAYIVENDVGLALPSPIEDDEIHNAREMEVEEDDITGPIRELEPAVEDLSTQSSIIKDEDDEHEYATAVGSSSGSAAFQSTSTSVASPARSIRFADENGLPIEEVFYLGGPDDAGATHRIIILLLNAKQRKFEFIQTEFRVNGDATVTDLLQQIPAMATNELFVGKCYVAIFRMGNGEEFHGLEDYSHLRDHDFEKNEVVIGVMEGNTGSDMVKCARPLLANEKIVRAVKSARRSGRGLKYIFSAQEMEDERSETMASCNIDSTDAVEPNQVSLDGEEEHSDDEFEDAAMDESDISDYDDDYAVLGSPTASSRMSDESPTQYVEYVDKDDEYGHTQVVKYIHAGLMATVGMLYGYSTNAQ